MSRRAMVTKEAGKSLTPLGVGDIYELASALHRRASVFFLHRSQSAGLVRVPGVANGLDAGYTLYGANLRDEVSPAPTDVVKGMFHRDEAS